MTFLFYFILNKDTMIISKCVPMEISRKRFSQFDEQYNPQGMQFVGWKFDEVGNKINVRLDYQFIKDDIENLIKQFIENNGGFPTPPEEDDDNTQGGNPDKPNLGANETFFHKLTTEGDNPTYNEFAESHIVNLKKELGAVEINGGGDYCEETVYFTNPIIGSVTHIVVDNTGRDKEKNETEEEWVANRKPVNDFVLYYGVKRDDNRELALVVPPWNRGVVQVLHTKNADLIINSSYSPAIVDEYVADEEPSVYDDGSDINIVTPDGEISNLDIDMKNERGYVEFIPDDHDEYTFWFSSPELGTMTYIVIDNTVNEKDVLIYYGKEILDQPEKSYRAEITNVIPYEKCIIEVFHSLSADIIVKITKI